MQTAKADPSLLQSARNTEVGERFNRTLFAALDSLEERKIGYALIGGVASSGLGRPRSTHDIDIFVRPEDAGAALEALEKKGFRTEKTDFNWLFKGFREEILVDIIFRSRGDIYFDTEMHQRARPVEYHGREVRTVSPEDLIIIKCAVHDEIGPHHWHDALAILSHATLDWDYLLKRARRAPRRLLALLFYAQSNDIWVPNKIIFELFKTIFGDSTFSSSTSFGPTSISSKDTQVKAAPEPQPARINTEQHASRKQPTTYVVGKVKDALTQDARTGQQDLKIMVEGNHLLIRGEAQTEEQRRAIEEVVHENAPQYEIDNKVTISKLSAPEGEEDVA
ncbi:MAG: nucleotidyltransferase [Bdellovibrionota bacterium]